MRWLSLLMCFLSGLLFISAVAARAYIGAAAMGASLLAWYVLYRLADRTP